MGLVALTADPPMMSAMDALASVIMYESESSNKHRNTTGTAKRKREHERDDAPIVLKRVLEGAEARAQRDQGPACSTAPQTKFRRPYRFCSKCWTVTQEFILRCITLPSGQTVKLNNHSHAQCFRIRDGGEEGDFANAAEKRSHMAAYKHAQRRGTLYQIALKQFQEALPEMNHDEISHYLLS